MKRSKTFIMSAIKGLAFGACVALVAYSCSITQASVQGVKRVKFQTPVYRMAEVNAKPLKKDTAKAIVVKPSKDQIAFYARVNQALTTIEQNFIATNKQAEMIDKLYGRTQDLVSKNDSLQNTLGRKSDDLVILLGQNYKLLERSEAARRLSEERRLKEIESNEEYRRTAQGLQSFLTNMSLGVFLPFLIFLTGVAIYFLFIHIKGRRIHSLMTKNVRETN